MSSTTMSEANAKASEAAAMQPSPPSTVGLTPTRAAINPPGSAPSSVPAAYMADRKPAADFERPSSST
jgi:hypothetical protein